MKIETKAILKQYDTNLKNYESLAKLVKHELIETINKHCIKTHAISHRIKELNSLLDKVRRKKLENPFEQLHDIVGFRIVCLFLPDLQEINKIIHELFEVFKEDDKINNSELNIFGYMSLHLKCRMKDPKINEKSEQSIPFEIQVRTIAQDAWASISHYLDYKKESVIPEQLKRDFHALSGLFYVADTHFSILRKEQLNIFFEENKKKYNKSPQWIGNSSANFIVDSSW